MYVRFYRAPENMKKSQHKVIFYSTEANKEFQSIPGVGKSLNKAFIDLGYQSITELKDENPETMYQNLIKFRGCHVDRCVLYVFRCAVYFAGHTSHDPELLKWWNWKDGNHKYNQQLNVSSLK